MKRRLISLIMVLLGFAAGAQAGDFCIGGNQLTVGQSYNSLNGPSCLWAGTITFTDATHVTLENVTINLNASGGVANRIAISSDIPNLVITLIGDNKIQGDGVKTGLYFSYSTGIKGDGSLDIVAVENGIEAVASANLTITDAHVKAKGGTNGIKGVQSGLYTKGNGIFEAYGGTKCVAGIKRFGESVVTAPAGATFKTSVLSVVDENDNPISNQWVVIEKAILVNETNFPDENFRNWILEQDYGKDGILTNAEIASVTEMTIWWEHIDNLQGIEFFTSLKYLNCQYNQLTSFDLSKNTALVYLLCGNNRLTSLDLSKNTALKSLSCDNNQLNSLDVSEYTALEILDCSENPLKTLDVSKNTTLERLSCKNIQLTSLDVSKNTALVDLDCRNNQLTSLDVSNNTALKSLSCSENPLKTLDVSKNTALESLSCANNQLTSLDVSNNMALSFLGCPNNLLTSLDVSNNSALTNLYCYGNDIHDESMTMLVNSLPTIDSGVGLFWAYQNLTPTDNILTTVQVKIARDKHWMVQMQVEDSNGNLVLVNYEGEPVLPIDETNFPDANFRNWLFAQDYGKDGYLSDAEIAGVMIIDLSDKEIVNLQGIEFFTALSELYCYNNKLTSLDVSQNTALTLLYCPANQLNTLDDSKNSKLTYLNCAENQLKTLDLSQNKALERLLCGSNQLTTLDLSQNTELDAVLCQNNQLTTLDFSKNEKLVGVSCYNNTIRGENMTAFVNSLPTVADGYIEVCYKEPPTGNEMTTLQVKIATDKHWRVLTSDGSGWVDYAGVKVAAQVSFDAATVNAVYGADFTAPTLTVTPESLGGSVTFTSSNNDVAKVDAETGAVTIVGVGEATITATVVSDQYEGSASYKITVIKITEGDANGNGMVDTGDVVAVVNAMKGWQSATFQSEAAETNGDEQLNIADIVKIVNIITNE